MTEETTADITDIDEIDRPEETAPEEPPAPEVPEHLVEQPCGLPKVLMEKAQLTQYEQDHGIDHPHRKKMQVTDRERELYEIYTGVLRNRRVTKEHFVAALRLFKAGYEIWPKREKDLNEMKVH